MVFNGIQWYSDGLVMSDLGWSVSVDTYSHKMVHNTPSYKSGWMDGMDLRVGGGIEHLTVLKKSK